VFDTAECEAVSNFSIKADLKLRKVAEHCF